MVHDLYMLKCDNNNSLETFLKKYTNFVNFNPHLNNTFKQTVLTFIVSAFSLYLKNEGKIPVKYEYLQYWG